MISFLNSTSSRLILVDFGYFSFTAIYAHIKNRTIPPTKLALSMLAANLRNVAIMPEDIVIIAVDSSLGSWRKEIDVNYKADRKVKRQKEEIDWSSIFGRFRHLLDYLDYNSPFHIIEVEKCEADDIIAIACKKFSDKKCIVISTDSDFEQLIAYPNVLLFSPKSKKYKEVKNPYKIIASKIKKERTDNLVSPILTQEDYEKRNSIINLLTLPNNIVQAVSEKLVAFPKKEWNFDSFPFWNLIPRFQNMYNNESHVPKKKKRKKEQNQLTL